MRSPIFSSGFSLLVDDFFEGEDSFDGGFSDDSELLAGELGFLGAGSGVLTFSSDLM